MLGLVLVLVLVVFLFAFLLTFLPLNIATSAYAADERVYQFGVAADAVGVEGGAAAEIAYAGLGAGGDSGDGLRGDAGEEAAEGEEGCCGGLEGGHDGCWLVALFGRQVRGVRRFALFRVRGVEK